MFFRGDISARDDGTGLNLRNVFRKRPAICPKSNLNQLIQQQMTVDVFLTSGIKLSGYITAFDNYTLTMGGKTTQLIYKHAISTICQQQPSRD